MPPIERMTFKEWCDVIWCVRYSRNFTPAYNLDPDIAYDTLLNKLYALLAGTDLAEKSAPVKSAETAPDR